MSLQLAQDTLPSWACPVWKTATATQLQLQLTVHLSWPRFPGWGAKIESDGSARDTVIELIKQAYGGYEGLYIVSAHRIRKPQADSGIPQINTGKGLYHAEIENYLSCSEESKALV